MRQRAAESDVVIVNHHLLCADAAVRKSAYGEVIPSCATLVVDEAHQLEDVATQYFGVAVSNYRIEDLLRDVEATVAGLEGPPRNEVYQAITRVAERSRCSSAASQWPECTGGCPPRRRARRRGRRRRRATRQRRSSSISRTERCSRARSRASRRHARVLAADSQGAVSRPSRRGLGERTRCSRRSRGEPAICTGTCRFLIRAADADFVYYLEIRGRGIFLRASPIDVSRIAREALFDRMRATVLTSATLAVDGSFEYVKSRLGIREAAEVRVPSEFDYARQALLYLPRRIPSPKAPTFSAAAAREVIEILKRSRGRAFVLFTSYAMLRAVQQFVEMSLPFPILVQGTAPRSTLHRAVPLDAECRAAGHLEFLAGR